jgi:hypothetical protein
VWNVSAGEDSFPATSGYYQGQYWPLHKPDNVFDDNLNTELCSYGFCNVSYYDFNCGTNTGVYVTTQYAPFVLDAFRTATGSYGPWRDPLTITIEGSNQNGSNLTLGSSWTLIYNGTSGLSTNPGRNMLGTKQILLNNTLSFASYRFLIVEKRDNNTCVEYAEIQLFGH